MVPKFNVRKELINLPWNPNYFIIRAKIRITIILGGKLGAKRAT